MVRPIKKMLFKVLGKEQYLKTLHLGFFSFYRSGLLKSNPDYRYHYFVKNLVRKGDTAVDIGANLGYYTGIFSGLVGTTGTVFSVEPMKPFFKVVNWAFHNRKNCILNNYALGLENKMIEMILPGKDGYMRTGLAHIPSDESEKKDSLTFSVEMVKGSALLASLARIDYIKCDIEGYEDIVLPEIRSIIEKHKPMLQIETWGPHKAGVFKLMQDLGYEFYDIDKGKLIKGLDNPSSCEYLFLHKDAAGDILGRLKALGKA